MQDRSMSILLVEDNAADARLLREMLHDAGGEDVVITQARNLPETFERLDSERFSIILLDLGLPESRGLETFTRVHEAHPDVPIVVLSGLDDEDVAISAVQEGAQDYLVKQNISGGSLLRAVRYAIERHSALQRELSQMRRGGESGTIAFVGAKGGVGTTTLVVNFASALANRGQSAIAIELRGEPGTLSSLLSRTPPENISHLVELGARQITPETLGSRLQRTPFGLRVLFGPQEARQEVEVSAEQAAAIVDSASELADFTILDIPSYPTEAGREAMRRAWRVFLLLEPEAACMYAARVSLDVLRTAGVTGQLMGAIVVNRSALPVAPSAQEIQELLGVDVVGVVPPAAEPCAAAQRSGIPVVVAQPESVFSASVIEIVDRLTSEQIGRQTVW